jgi:tetratricopeptide (TPR) repeat protein
MAARAIAHAERALALAPDLAEAHGVLGMLTGFDRPLGRQHIERAAALDPSNAEFQYWLGAVYGVHTDFARMNDAYRGAYTLDPLWSYAQEAVVRSAWEMGHQDEALVYVRRIETDGSAHQAHLIRAVLAHARGDLSEEARELAAASNATTDPGRRADSEWRRGMVFEQLGLFNAAYEARRRSGMNDDLVRPEADPHVQIRQGKLPTISELSFRNRNVSYSWRDLGYVGRAAKLFVNSGRARDIVSLYDGEGILLISRRGPPALPARVFEDGPVIAAALRAVGRNEEADRILAHVDREIAAALRRSGGRVPPRFLALAAQTWAMLGRNQAAMSALERATANGWLYVSDLDDSSLADFGDEPAFRSLRGQPRFEAIRARINGNLARERQQALAAADGRILGPLGSI